MVESAERAWIAIALGGACLLVAGVAVAFMRRNQDGGKSGLLSVPAVIAGLVAIGILAAGAAFFLFVAPRERARQEARERPAAPQTVQTVPMEVDPALAVKPASEPPGN